jgi:hypothetical protein
VFVRGGFWSQCLGFRAALFNFNFFRVYNKTEKTQKLAKKKWVCCYYYHYILEVKLFGFVIKWYYYYYYLFSFSFGVQNGMKGAFKCWNRCLLVCSDKNMP